MFTRNARHLAGALILAAGLAGCESALAPGDQAFDADATTADLAAVDATGESEAMKSLELLGGNFGVSGGQAASASAALLRVAREPMEGSASARAVSLARDIQSALYSSANSSAPLIPAQYLGVTMVWNGERYVIDEEATGGPANGIRFILYAVNPITDRIADELVEIGYADVMDVGGESSSAVQLVVVAEGITHADYTVTATGVFNNPTIVIAGFLSNGEEQVDFTLSHTVAATFASTQVDLDYHIEIASRDFTLDIVVQLTEAGEESTASVDMTLTHGRNEVVLSGSTTNGVGALEVLGNGELFATINVDGDDVEVITASGEPLTERQVRALRDLWQMFEKALEAFENLFRPVHWLFEIG